jgi:general secretion pathway protein H
MMPTSAPGNKQRGFTLIELLVVIALMAIASAMVSLSLRDPEGVQLEREAERLVALFETARAESRASGLAVQWLPTKDVNGEGFVFQGLPPGIAMPKRWLKVAPAVEIAGDRLIRLGPEPMIGAQSLQLRLGAQSLKLASDGLGPFEVSPIATP